MTRERALDALLALVLAFVLACALTWPAVAHLDQVIVGGGELGGWLWRYDWHFTELEALAASDLGPVESLRIFLSLGRFPETGNILDVLLISWPLSRVVELPASYDVKVLLILVGNGLCAWVLASDVSRSRSAALAASSLGVLNPLVLQDVHGSGLRQVLLWWLLLLPVAFERMGRTLRPRDGALAGACLAMAGAWYWFYGLFGGMYFAVWLGWRLRRHRGLGGMGRALLTMLLVCFLVASLFAVPYATSESGGDAGAGALPELSFFLPFPEYDVIREVPLRPSTYEENVLSSLNRTIMSSWCADYLWNPAYYRALPLAVLVGGLIPALAIRGPAAPLSRRWVSVFLLFWLGTLGPFLKLGVERDSSEVLVLGGEWVVRLPYAWMFRWIPGMARMFAPYRMASMVVVAAVALVAVGLSRIQRPWLRMGVSALVVGASLLQYLYRWDLGPVPEGAYAPDRWRAPLKVSEIRVPEWYLALEKDAPQGIIELPLEQQQDLLATYQATHGWKVYRSWAGPQAIPPAFREEGGGEAGEHLRFLAAPDQPDLELERLLLEISRAPRTANVEALRPESLAELQPYRWLVVHERGFYLLDPQMGAEVYADVVARLGRALAQEPVEQIELEWRDYPGNEYKVPDGPVYVPWSSQEVSLPDAEMPNRYRMAVFDLEALRDEAAPTTP